MRISAGQKFNFSLPYGAHYTKEGVLFSLVCRSAEAVRLLLYDNVEDMEPTSIIHLDKQLNRWGDVWSIFLHEAPPGLLYHFQVDGPLFPEQGDCFDSSARLIDPYAKALAGEFQNGNDGVIRPPKCVVIDNSFDWIGEKQIHRDLTDSVIYELHVRGFTHSPQSAVKHPGTYLGLMEKIPYLKSLGVSAVELMPVAEFPTNETDGSHKEHQNFWGYDPLVFFAPHRGYAAGTEPGVQVREFKQMVLAFHQAGIEVILDVVFNHTCEGNEHGPILSFKGLDNRSYYMLDSSGHYKNYSGCGNTINGNHPLTRELIFNCLRYWVHNYHIDGFRFDLASILSRDQGGNLVANPPILETISEDPMLAGTKIIAEAWDAAGAYQVGSFGSKRWAEWNGRFRDDVRRFIRGDNLMAGPFATRLTGSSDLYQQNNRLPGCSINFLTAHDGFTLNDLVSYNDKHNLANGENNRDGENSNNSWNHGIEGAVNDPGIEAFREREIKNFLTTLFMSQGVPMLLAGDEVRRTQKGNNNAYCQDNEISWFDWDLVVKNESLFRFCKNLIYFRRKEPVLRQKKFLSGQPRITNGFPDVAWFSNWGGPVAWIDQNTHSFTMFLAAVEGAPDSNYHLLLMFNSSFRQLDFTFPCLCLNSAMKWELFVDTETESPRDIFPAGGPVADPKKNVSLSPHSIKVYRAKRF